MAKLFIYTSLAFFFSSPFLRAEVITMATGEWPPFYGAKLPKQGVVSEIARQALKATDHEFIINFMPWARAMHEVKKGTYHGLFGCWVNEQVKKDYVVSKEIIGSGDGHFLVQKDNMLSGLTPEDLDGKVVGIIRNYPVSETLKGLFEHGKVVKKEVSQLEQLYGLLELKRIDVILENYQVAKYHFLKIFPGKEFNLKIVGKDNIDGGLYICWSKNKVEIKAIAQAFDRAVRQMRSDGTLNNIEQTFGLH